MVLLLNLTLVIKPWKCRQNLKIIPMKYQGIWVATHKGPKRFSTASIWKHLEVAKVLYCPSQSFLYDLSCHAIDTWPIPKVFPFPGEPNWQPFWSNFGPSPWGLLWKTEYHEKAWFLTPKWRPRNHFYFWTWIVARHIWSLFCPRVRKCHLCGAFCAI